MTMEEILTRMMVGLLFLELMKKAGQLSEQSEEVRNLILFCYTPRTRKEICDYLGLSSVIYAIQRHIMPLVEKGLIHLSIPEKLSSQKPLYYSKK